MAEVGQQLVAQYYQQFDNKATRGNLAQIFHPNGTFSFDGVVEQTQVKIIEKLNSLPDIHHVNYNVDVQPSKENTDLVCVVVGQLTIDDNPPLFFTETFHFLAANGSYVIYNDIFRLVYG